MNGTLSGIIAIMMWSFMAVLIVYSGQTSPLTLTSLSLFIGAVTLLIFNIIKKENFRQLLKITFPDYCLVTVGVCFYTAFVYLSFDMVNPIEANILNYLWPVLFGVFSSIRMSKMLNAYELLGLLVSFGGVFLLFYGKENEFLFSSFALGHLFGIMAAFIWAGYSSFAKERSYSQIIMVPVFLFSALICFLVDFMLFDPILPNGMAWVSVLILGVFRISYAFWDYAMKKGNTLILSSLSYITPLLSFGLLLIFGVTNNSQYVFLSVLLVTGGCFFTNYKTIQKWIERK